MTTGEELPCAHFTVDKQNISLWPREPPTKTDRPLPLRKPSTVCAALTFLSLVLVTSVLLQGILYSWLLGTLSDAKINAQLLEGRVDNISTEGSEIQRNRGGLKAARIQIQRLNVNLTQMRSRLLTLEASLEKANAGIQRLTRSWEEVNILNAQIPELKRDLDKASLLNAKVGGLQSSLENMDKSLRQQNDILQMLSRGWAHFKGNYYYLSHISKTWYSAQQFCISRDSHLTSVTSESEQEFLYKIAGGQIYWIGLTKAGSEGDWHWIDGTPFNKLQSSRFWIPGEPNNFGNNEHCANIKRTSLQSWNDVSCDAQFFFICKKPYIPSEP
ncbi:PREDICTED: C-type lectin domain family 4 member K [Chrysochloris asiatica]|uniref:C-type lectin domain family 4 member K n=1 Tax=Chrysochloris asiatica TaxID=185453 RepID=A0A9B0TLK2_CHRAS|nr:PREDICTED: C-type lectin domain family 4 member K [Chrysochloris asiatica]